MAVSLKERLSWMRETGTAVQVPTRADQATCNKPLEAEKLNTCYCYWIINREECKLKGLLYFNKNKRFFAWKLNYTSKWYKLLVFQLLCVKFILHQDDLSEASFENTAFQPSLQTQSKCCQENKAWGDLTFLLLNFDKITLSLTACVKSYKYHA